MMLDLTAEELLLVCKYRETTARGHGEGEWATKDGKLVKLWTTDKLDIRDELTRVVRCREAGDGPRAKTGQ